LLGDERLAADLLAFTRSTLSVAAAAASAAAASFATRLARGAFDALHAGAFIARRIGRVDCAAFARLGARRPWLAGRSRIGGRHCRLASGARFSRAVAAFARPRVIAVASTPATPIAAPAALALALCGVALGCLRVWQGVDEQRIRPLLVGRRDRAFLAAAG